MRLNLGRFAQSSGDTANPMAKAAAKTRGAAGEASLVIEPSHHSFGPVVMQSSDVGTTAACDCLRAAVVCAFHDADPVNRAAAAAARSATAASESGAAEHWACSVCTLINPASERICRVCDAIRGSELAGHACLMQNGGAPNRRFA